MMRTSTLYSNKLIHIDKVDRVTKFNVKLNKPLDFLNVAEEVLRSADSKYARDLKSY